MFNTCEKGKHILTEGWHNWNKKHAENTVVYGEYNRNGEGANPQAHPKFSRQLKNLKGYDMQEVLQGTDNWNPTGKGNEIFEVAR